MTDTELKHEAQKAQKNELKKELMRSKAVAKLRHYSAGSLHYIIESEGGKSYLFSIPVVEKVFDQDADTERIILSSDLGTTPFVVEEKASMLWRWIDKAIDRDDFVSLPLPPSGQINYMEISINFAPPPPEPPPDRIIREGEEPPPLGVR